MVKNFSCFTGLSVNFFKYILTRCHCAFPTHRLVTYCLKGRSIHVGSRHKQSLTSSSDDGHCRYRWVRLRDRLKQLTSLSPILVLRKSKTYRQKIKLNRSSVQGFCNYILNQISTNRKNIRIHDTFKEWKPNLAARLV
jgi:hypothetical protein